MLNLAGPNRIWLFWKRLYLVVGTQLTYSGQKNYDQFLGFEKQSKYLKKIDSAAKMLILPCVYLIQISWQLLQLVERHPRYTLKAKYPNVFGLVFKKIAICWKLPEKSTQQLVFWALAGSKRFFRCSANGPNL